MCRIMKYIIGAILLVLAYDDWKTKRVSVWILGLVLLTTIIGRLFFFSMSIGDTLGGIGVGLFFLGISKVSKEAIGYGDSGLILALGIGFGGIRTLEIVFLSSFLTCLFSMVYCIRRGWNKKHTLPYVPFIAVAYWGGVFL